jgi:23S rRNA (guanosine2251-2'-O)-methyltransferase
MKENEETRSLEKIVGVHAVLEALVADEKKIETIYLIQGTRKGKLKEIEDRALFSGVETKYIAPSLLDRLSAHAQHQGVMAMVRPYRFIDVQQLVAETAEKNEPPFLLVIDQVQDPRNLGALLRNAEAAGVDGVIVTDRRTSPLSPVAVKASSGAASHLKISRVVNLVSTLEQLKTQGLWIVGAEPKATKTIYDLHGRDPVAVVVGSEGPGLRRLVRETCDWLVQIPMFGVVESLNVSVSAAILLYEIRRQRNFS